ncbi:hypothetical protein ACHAW6_010586, partial [Cyclotella cf. meneghiniana]
QLLPPTPSPKSYIIVSDCVFSPLWGRLLFGLHMQRTPQIMTSKISAIRFGIMLLLCSSCAQVFAWSQNGRANGRHSSTSVGISPRLFTSAERRNMSKHYNSLHAESSTDKSSEDDEPEEFKSIKDEIEFLRHQLTCIEALEELNKAQLDSFVNGQDQWDSMEEDERQLLRSKTDIEERLEHMTSELVTIWMGGKSMEG